MTPAAEFHADSGSVRFWIELPGGQLVGAIVSRHVLQYRYQAQGDGSDALATFRAHQGELDAAVRRRVASGSIEPVILREHDLAVAAPRPHTS